MSTVHGKKASSDGQNVLIIEIYPSNISSLCPQFRNKWAFAGCGHPVTSSFREGVIVCNVSKMTIYSKNYLDRCVHAGLSVELANDYVNEMIKQGYNIKGKEDFDSSSKHILIVGSDESVIIPKSFWVINFSTTEFNDEIDLLFTKCNLSIIGESLINPSSSEKESGSKNIKEHRS